MSRPSAARILAALQEELVACLAVLPATGRNERQLGQREALQHVVVFLDNQGSAPTPTPREGPCLPPA